MIREIRIGTRSSPLARRQTDFIVRLLREARPELCPKVETVTTQGDILQDASLPLNGGKGLFTEEIEKALLNEQIDLAVHSLKDLPVQSTDGLTIGAIPQRANPADALVSRKGGGLAELPAGARVGTSSLRRAAQLKHFRPDLKIVQIRGNVDTRLKKVFAPNGAYDAIVIAAAGLERLGALDLASEILPLDLMLPAPGQAALAAQCRNTPMWLDLLTPLNHPDTRLAVTAERAFLQGLGGGCALPAAAYAEVSRHRLILRGRIVSADGFRQIDLVRAAPLSKNDEDLQTAQRLGVELAQEAVTQGACEILEGVTSA